MRRAVIALILAVAVAAVAAGKSDDSAADKVHVADGSAVLTAGRLYVNITNWGLIGSRYSELSTYSDAPSGQWPGGSDNEYLFAAGLWIGGRVHGDLRVSTGQPEAELRPDATPQATIYEAREGLLVRPPNPGAGGIPWYLPGGDDDGDGLYDEEILNGYDDDGDGRIDEDFRQYGTQMFECTMRDNTLLASQQYPDHRPLDVAVHQRAFSWQTVNEQDFVVLSYTITNIGATVIHELYLGMWADCEIGHRNDPNAAQNDLAGTFDEYVRVPAGHFQPVRGAYMRDGATHNPLPGWFGIQIIGHTTDQNEVHAPETVRMHAARIISAGGSTWGGGPPLNDADRYQLLSVPGRDEDIPPDRAYDYSFVESVGPFPYLAPGEQVEFEVALCIADSREQLLNVCATAQQTQFGHWVDWDHNRYTGVYTLEKKVCAEDFYPVWNDLRNPLYAHNRYLWNRACLDDYPVIPDITPESLTWDNILRKHCIWVDWDYCEECERVVGVNCYDAFPPSQHKDRGGIEPAATPEGPYTGVEGREKQAPWVVLELPPPAPSIRIDPGDDIVRLYWDDRSEWSPDGLTGVEDFESYRLWRSDRWNRPPGSSIVTGPSRDSWRLMAEYDLVDQYTVTLPGGAQRVLDLGPNTGLEGVVYEPVCLTDPRYAGLGDAMRAIIEADTQNQYKYRPPLRDPQGRPVPGLESLLPWEDVPTVLDTFFAVTPREEAEGVVPKRATRYYGYVDPDVHNGYVYFYAVTATDHQTSASGDVITGPGIQGAPGANFAPALPRFRSLDPDKAAQRDVYVYPNPATREALAEFQQMAPNTGDVTGVRVAFANLPAALCRIEIFTLAGDLVATFEHDGRHGDGQAYWNLITRRNQEITSGIYLYAVTPQDKRFSRSVGKFVVVR